MNVVVSTHVLARLALAPAADTVHHALVKAGMSPDLVTRILEEDDTPQVGDWRAEQVLVLERIGIGCVVSNEGGVETYPTSYLTDMPLIDVNADDDVATHMAAML